MKNNEAGAKAPKSTAERQRTFKERMKARGLFEVRGIYASKENAKKIKAFADGLD